jgi:hypothetical protein
MDRIFTQKKISSKLNATKDDKQSDFSEQPGDDVISAIVNYSKSLVVKKSTITEQIEMVLN